MSVVAGRFSRGDLLLLTALLALFGIVVSAYLAWQWYAAAGASWCDLGSYFSCSRVRESPYAAVAGVPTATVGVVGFGILLSLAGLALRGRERVGPWTTPRWIVVFAAVGAGIGAILTVIEVAVIQAVCVLCVLAFVLDLAILGIGLLLARVDS